jgi:uncharacterized membrane protein YdbT with pleckstrin-like domain
MRTRIAVVVGVAVALTTTACGGSSPYSSQVTRRELTPEQQQRVDEARELREAAQERERADALRQRDVETALRQRAEFERRQAREANLDRTTVTAAEYRQLDTGMSYARAVEIIGFQGTELSRNEIAGITTVMLQWTNRDGGNMNAMFQNGRLVQKAQFGLR